MGYKNRLPCTTAVSTGFKNLSGRKESLKQNADISGFRPFQTETIESETDSDRFKLKRVESEADSDCFRLKRAESEVDSDRFRLKR
jgi:hypothetical protein